MSTAYIFGCSHAAGSEMFDGDIDLEYTNSFPALIAQQLGYQICNHAIPGGSNDAVFRALCEVQAGVCAEDLVLFCWTGPDRCEFFCEQNRQWLQFSLGRPRFHVTEPHATAKQGRFLGELIDSEQDWLDFMHGWQRLVLGLHSANSYANRSRNVLAANHLAQQRTSKVVNFISFGGYDEDHWPLVRDLVWPINDYDFCRWAKSRGFLPTAAGHFGHDAHLAFAEAMKERLIHDFGTQ